jgi:hypothetical protein
MIISLRRRAAQPSSPELIALTFEFEVTWLSPRNVRRRFAHALRIAIAEARMAGVIDGGIAEELWRVVRDPERA